MENQLFKDIVQFLKEENLITNKNIILHVNDIKNLNLYHSFFDIKSRPFLQMTSWSQLNGGEEFWLDISLKYNSYCFKKGLIDKEEYDDNLKYYKHHYSYKLSLFTILSNY